jgi:cytidylate kinase
LGAGVIVTIDGPAGAGKSTAARRLAERLGFLFLDTGAMYRAVTWHCQQRGIPLTDPNAVEQAARSMRLELVGHRVLVDGHDVSAEIRSREVTQESRYVAANNAVRAFLVELQRQFAEGRDVVTEGRDQGTVAFPHAECKFFLVADPRERALRRQRELAGKGQQIALEELLEQQTQRDERDSQREFGTMRAAADARVVDTSRLTLDEVVDHLEQVVRDGRA